MGPKTLPFNEKIDTPKKKQIHVYIIVCDRKNGIGVSVSVVARCVTYNRITICVGGYYVYLHDVSLADSIT